MGRPWTVADLKEWDERIREKVNEFGLDCFAQEFEVCDHEQMLGFMAYSGMPAHYPHWSYGKSYEKLKTLYDYGVSGLPYEMVINANPSLAYLMRDNTLCLQVLTIAHVYGHNDFFANNFTFRHTRPELTIARMKNRADRIRDYYEDPSIGVDKVESLLDAAHALSMNCRRDFAIRKAPAEGGDGQLGAVDAGQVDDDGQPRVPAEPEEDLLLFIAENNPYLAEWERDVLHIVAEEAQYFIPQIETKIMNEGWASYWHHCIMNSLELPDDLHLEFLVNHNQVIRPHPGGINPYHVGFMIWHDIERRYTDPTPEDIEEFGEPEKGAMEKMFEVRETDRDVAFLRRFLTPRLMRELDLFEHEEKRGKRVVSAVSDDEHWQQVKRTLLANVGTAAMPVIKIWDADYGRNRELYLKHEYDGRELKLDYAERTLSHLHQLWGRRVLLETEIKGRPLVLTHSEEGPGRLDSEPTAH